MDEDRTISNHWLDDLAGLPPLVDSSYRREPFPYRGWTRLWHCAGTSFLFGMPIWFGVSLAIDTFTPLSFPHFLSLGLATFIPLFWMMFFSKSEYG